MACHALSCDACELLRPHVDIARQAGQPAGVASWVPGAATALTSEVGGRAFVDQVESEKPVIQFTWVCTFCHQMCNDNAFEPSWASNIMHLNRLSNPSALPAASLVAV